MPEEPKNINYNNLGFVPLDEDVQSPIVKAMKVLRFIFDGPTSWFRKNIVEKYKGEPYPYYHRKYHDVPDINECYVDDLACVYEAQCAYLRKRRVDNEIVKILRERFLRCQYWQANINDFEEFSQLCQKERQDLNTAEVNFFIKYGELGPYTTVIDAFMKQKHRLIWERRQKEKGLLVE